VRIAAQNDKAARRHPSHLSPAIGSEMGTNMFLAEVRQKSGDRTGQHRFRQKPDRAGRPSRASGSARGSVSERSGTRVISSGTHPLIHGRENLEDYNAVFLIQLESWEAALKSGLALWSQSKTHQAIEIAKLLGWTEQHGETPQLNRTARACPFSAEKATL
jgi:hypothetical protein